MLKDIGVVFSILGFIMFLETREIDRFRVYNGVSNEALNTEHNNNSAPPSVIGNIDPKTENKVIFKPKKISRLYIIPDHTSAYIGEEQSEKEIYDNLFFFEFQQDISNTDQLLLRYKLVGLANKESVKRKINDGPVIGGKFIKISNSESQQTEVLPSTLFNVGLNKITFYPILGISYRIEDLTIEILKHDFKSDRININPITAVYDSSSIYVNGYIHNPNNENIRLMVDNTLVSIINSEFQYFKHQDSTHYQTNIQVNLWSENESILDTILIPIFSQSSIYLKNNISYTQDNSIKPVNQLKFSLLHWKTKMNDVSIRGLNESEILIPSNDLINVSSGYAGYRIVQQKLNEPDTVLIPYDPKYIPYGYNESDIFPFFFDELRRKWIKEERLEVDKENDQVKVKRNKSGDYINGIIKVPESPDSKGFSPTIMKDFKPADASIGITMIEPPKPNQKGSVNLSYPLKLPQGRQGMQPELNIAYNSEGGNGWMGLGWDLQTPFFTIETRWGVPRYDHTMETETYLFNGEMLTDNTHRSELEPRSIRDKVFHPRIEGKFDSIIRHGTNPKNYWWEVINKNGTRHFYGGNPESGVIDNAVLKDDEGNIGHWALSLSIDANDNTIVYEYQIIQHSGTPGSSNIGRNIYPLAIYYSGYQKEKGKYRISFNLEGDREDASINARLGFKQVTAHRCQNIRIEYANETIRSYDLKYTEGAFYKSLLKEIIERDEKGNEFYKHSMDYFDKARIDENNYLIYSDKRQHTWNVPDDGVKGDGFEVAEHIGFNYNASLLGGTQSSSNGWGLSASIGLWDGIFGKTNTLGGSYTRATSQADGIISLIDIDGDGLPDKLFKNREGLFYRTNKYSSDIKGFGSKNRIFGINSFSQSKTRTSSKGWETYPLIAFIGESNSTGLTKNNIYPTDFNADGLPDIVSNSSVYFSTIDKDLISYFPNSSITENPIISKEKVSDELAEKRVNSSNILIKENPLHDVVRLWIAPFTGKINITGAVRLINMDPSDLFPNKDGVRLIIQKNEDELDSIKISANDFRAHSFSNKILNVNVQKNDRLYFRLQSIFNGECDRVSWDPIITYISEKALNRDANNMTLGRFRASEDFILNSPQLITSPFDGIVRISGQIKKPKLTDDITLQIFRQDTTNKDTILYSKKYFSNEEFSEEIQFDIHLFQYESVKIKFLANSTVDWNKLQWEPQITFIHSDHGEQIQDVNGEFRIKLNPAFEVPIFNNYNDYFPKNPFISKDGGELKCILKPILPDGTLFNSKQVLPTGEVTVVIKTEKGLIGKSTLKMSSILEGGAKEFDPITSFVARSESIFIEAYFSNDSLASCMDVSVNISGVGDEASFIADEYTPVDSSKIIYGNIYRGWGQFAYNANFDSLKNIDRTYTRLIEADLNLDKYKKTNFDKSKIDKSFGPENEIFIVLFSLPKSKAWYGGDTSNFSPFISSDQMQSSRLGLDDVEIEKVTGSFGAFGIIKLTESINNSQTVSLDIPLGTFTPIPLTVPIAGSHSTGSTSSLFEVLDLNGDRYPDVLSTNKVQYTNQIGGLSKLVLNHHLNAHTTKNESWGASLSGGYSRSNSNNSNSPGANSSIKSQIQTMQRSLDKANNANQSAAQSLSFSINGSLGFNQNSDESNSTWLDINGDGLPDKIYNNGNVALNSGYRFLPTEKWNFSSIRSGDGLDISGGVGLGASYLAGSISVGYGLSKTMNDVKTSLLDVNGDGLVDFITSTNPMKVRLNGGAKFGPIINWQGADWKFEEAESISESANGAFTVTIPIFLFVVTLKVCINPSISHGKGISRQITQIVDINGDGFPDFLRSERENNLVVRESVIDKTNLLRSISCPLNAQIDLDYTISRNTYDMPSSKWLLTSVKKFDGFAGDGVDTMYMRYHYDSGFYNRREREFYGFQTVITEELDNSNNNQVYRKNTQTFKNRAYGEKGLLVNEMLEDGDGKIFNETSHTYDFLLEGRILTTNTKEEKAWIYPRLKKTEYKYYEGGQTSITNTNTFEYDRYGNLTQFTDDGDKSKLTTIIDYDVPSTKYLRSIPTRVRVFADNKKYRHTEAKVNPLTGDVSRIAILINEKDSSDFLFEYDKFGNLKNIKKPRNAKGERMEYNYEYDTNVNTYVTKVTDAFKLEINSKYDPKYGQLLETVDPNDQMIRYTLDEKGRILTILGPNEIESGRPYTIKYEYHPESKVPYAQTSHFDPETGNNIETYTFIDANKKLLQSKKTGVITNESGGKADEMIVSGRQFYDAFGRVIESYYPVTEPMGTESVFNLARDRINPTKMRYDILDRELEVELPDGIKTIMTYDIAQDKTNSKLFRETTIDGKGMKKEKYSDVRDRIRSTRDISSQEGDIWTLFTYDPVDQLIEVKDDAGNPTILNEYDMLGRRIYTKHIDAGVTTFNYDQAGNMISKQTAVLSSWNSRKPSRIEYTYDHERLTGIIYPKYNTNNVKYHYGKPEDKHNGRAGRIWLQEDGSGGQEFFYGKLGEVTKEIRTILLGNASAATYITQYKYDTWNRLQQITYPDGEILDYSYNKAGKLHGMTGFKEGTQYTYVKSIGYDKFEQRINLRYGNDVETKYTFDDNRRRLIRLQATSPEQNIMDLNYSYDNVNNITGLSNTITPRIHYIGGNVKHQYTYDDFYRLKSATGSSAYFNATDTLLHNDEYLLSLEYDKLYNIKRKKAEINRDGVSNMKENYDFEYEYKDSKSRPHVLSKITNKRVTRIFAYDANGNQTSFVEQTGQKNQRISYWDEENRLAKILDIGTDHFYSYDAKGERVVKSHTVSNGLLVNGAPVGVINHTENYIAYINPFLVARDSSFTKHYFIDDQRILIKEGTGKFYNKHVPGRDIGLSAGNLNYYRKLQAQDSALAEFYKSLRLAPGHPSQAGLGAQPDRGGLPIPDLLKDVSNYSNPPRNWPSTLPTAPKDSTPGHPIWVLPEPKPDSAQAGLGFVGDSITKENEVYYYHPDHLGSANYISNDSGLVIQRSEYMPFGELFIDHHASDNIRQEYLYTNKELDDLTGLYYYGARYYDPKLSMWASVDPLVSKYPGVSPYNFTLLSPINNIDPNGKDVFTATPKALLNFIVLKAFGESNTAAAKSAVETFVLESVKIPKPLELAYVIGKNFADEGARQVDISNPGEFNKSNWFINSSINSAVDIGSDLLGKKSFDKVISDYKKVKSAYTNLLKKDALGSSFVTMRNALSKLKTKFENLVSSYTKAGIKQTVIYTGSEGIKKAVENE